MKQIAFFATQETASYVRSFEAHTATIRHNPQRYGAEFAGVFFLDQVDHLSPDEWTDFLEQVKTLDIIIGFMSPMLLVYLLNVPELCTLLTDQAQVGRLALMPLPILECRWRTDINPFQGCWPLVGDPVKRDRDEGLYRAVESLVKVLKPKSAVSAPKQAPVWTPSTPQPLPAHFSPISSVPAPSSHTSGGRPVLLIHAREDETCSKLLERHFKAAGVAVQQSGDVKAGSIRLDEYRKHVQQAKVILILESADCFADGICEAYLDLVKRHGNVVRVVKCRPLAGSMSYQALNTTPLSQARDKETMVQQIVAECLDLL